MERVPHVNTFSLHTAPKLDTQGLLVVYVDEVDQGGEPITLQTTLAMTADEIIRQTLTALLSRGTQVTDDIGNVSVFVRV